MNLLVIGSGGREHALAWAISRSPLTDRLYCAPGNPGMARHGACVALDAADHGAVITFCRDHAIALVVIGPEAPLVAGLADSLAAAGIAAFGPSASAARLEGSKGFTKDLCRRHGIPTADYERFADADAAKRHVMARGAPIVVKADGLAAGKGVTVAESLEEACAAIDDIFSGKFGAAGAEVVVEEFLQGEEASFFALCDGARILPFGTAQDHKRVGDGDTGPNTGGMGAYSPAPVMSQALIKRAIDEIIMPTVRGMAEMGCPYKGVLYAGLMLTAAGPKLIEYNVRFGDPECQVLLPRLESDIVELMLATIEGRLDGAAARWSKQTALTVVMASKGYPGAYAKGGEIRGIEAAEALDQVEVFHAGTALEKGRLVAAGGRVLNITALGGDVAEAQARAYDAVARIDWPDGFCRSDIGWRALGARGKESAA